MRKRQVEQVHLEADLVGDPDQRGVRERREVEVGEQRPGVVRAPLVGRVDRVEQRARRRATPRRRPAPGSARTSGWASSMITVHAQCGRRSAASRRRARRPVDRADLRLGVGGDRGGVERRVLDVVAHRADVVRPHRLDVHQGAAVVEVELAVPRVVDGVAEVHELRRRADVELEPLEDRDDVAGARRDRRVAERLLHPAGVDRRGRRPTPRWRSGPSPRGRTPRCTRPCRSGRSAARSAAAPAPASRARPGRGRRTC